MWRPYIIGFLSTWIGPLSADNSDLSNSPEQELRTLNGAVENVRDWLRQRHASLRELSVHDSNKLQDDAHLVEKLIAEAKVQQEGVDVLLDRGQRYLAQRANIVLEVDLENLVFLWNSYVDELRQLHSSVLKFTKHSVASKSHLSKRGASVVDDAHLYSDQLSIEAGKEAAVSNFDLCLPEKSDSESDSHSQENCVKQQTFILERGTAGTSSDSDESEESVISSGVLNHKDTGDLTLEDLATASRPLEIGDLTTDASCQVGEAPSHCQAAPGKTGTKNKPPSGSQHNDFTSNGKFKNSTHALEGLKGRRFLDQGDSTMEESNASEKVKMETANGLGNVSNEDVPKLTTLPSLPLLLDIDGKNSSVFGEDHESLIASCEMVGLQTKEMPITGSPLEPKRRRVLLHTPLSTSTLSSRSGSPLSLFDDSGSTTPTGTLTRTDRRDELWKAIGSIDHFLLDKGIIEACKSTEKDLSCESEDFVGAPSVSFAEFLQQYKELTDWLNQVHKVTQREVTSLSEKYLNQSYHEEMLERSPRREFLNDYSRQLLHRNPNMADQVTTRMDHLNAQWAAVEKTIGPKHGQHDPDVMLQDLECDLDNLRRWLKCIEGRLLPLAIQADWTDSELDEKLILHQALQTDIESHNKVVNAVLKLSERLEQDSSACGSDRDRDSLQLVALNLERRWHGIWLQSLEWQCRLEEAIGRRKGIYQSGFDFSGFTLPVLDESLFSQCSQDVDERGLITLDDDSLLFIGRQDYGFDPSSPLTPGLASGQESGVNTTSDDCHSQRSSRSSIFANESSNILLDGCDSDGGVHSSLDGIHICRSSSNSLSSVSKPDSPLGKRRIADSAQCEGSPAKRGFSTPSSFCGGFSPVSGVESSDQSSPSSPPILQRSEPLQIKKVLFDRSSGDSANISEAESKMGDSPPGPVAISPDHAVPSSDGENEQQRLAPRVSKGEIKDIGYSSESQSNDEVEMMRQQIEMECKFPGKCEVASDGPLGDKIIKIPTGVRPDFYFMTHVTDIDSTDKTDNGDTTDSGAEKLREKPLCMAVEDLMTKDVCMPTLESHPESDSTRGLEDSWEFHPSGTSVGLSAGEVDDLSLGEEQVVPHEAPMVSTSQPQSLASNMQPMYQLFEVSESDSAPESKEKKSVRYLIDHAEELVRPPSPRRSGSSSPIKTLPPSSFLLPSKQTQTDTCSAVESSCDASGEDNTDHEVFKQTREEISTGTDDAEDKTLCDSVINMDSATESNLNMSNEDVPSSSALPFPTVMDSPRLRKQTGISSRRRAKKDRPWSVVGFQDLSSPKKTDHQQPSVAASESAINHLQCYTDSDSSPRAHTFLTHSSTFPRSSRSHNYRRAYSVSEQTVVSDSKSAKRKLKFPSSYSSNSKTNASSPMSSISTYSYHDIPNATQDTTFTTFSPPGTKTSPGHLQSMSSDSSSGIQGRRKPRSSRQRSSLEGRDNRLGHLSRSSATESYDSAEAESESESADEYLTARMEVSTSEADEIHNVSGSMSDHSTWDNYQMVYPTASEDPAEELLAWEPQDDDLEFDDDFQLPANKSIVTDVMAAKPKSKLKFNKQGMACEDSDSDLEDFHHILDQSEHQLKLADQSLRKKRKDPMGTCLHPNPAKYEEILMTYETNIKCLRTICTHLNTEDVTEADVQRVQDLMYQWEKLSAFASERHNQTSTLIEMRDRMSAMTVCIQEAGDYLPYERFTTAEELKDTISLLKGKQTALARQAKELESMQKELEYFATLHPTVCVDKYLMQVSSLVKATAGMADKVNEHLDNLENNRIVWLEYLESQRELDLLLAADRERLYSLLSQREFGGKITKKDVLRELENLQANLSVYESKLEILQTMRAKLTRVSNEEAQTTLLASLGDLRNQLFVVSQRCKAIYRDIGDEEELPLDQNSDLGQLAMSAAALHEVFKSGTDKSSTDLSQPVAEASMEGKKSSVSMPPPVSRRCMWWLRSLPVQVVALVLVAGLVCALDPDILDRLANFSLTVTPELRYVNGPPAV